VVVVDVIDGIENQRAREIFLALGVLFQTRKSEPGTGTDFCVLSCQKTAQLRVSCESCNRAFLVDASVVCGSLETARSRIQFGLRSQSVIPTMSDLELPHAAAGAENNSRSDDDEVPLQQQDTTINPSSTAAAADDAPDLEAGAVGIGREEQQDESELFISIPSDVYALFLVSRPGGLSSMYALYVFALKMTLYIFLSLDVFDRNALVQTENKVVAAAQFLMIPVAVAMQADLVDSFHLIANAKYDHPAIQQTKMAPASATFTKYVISVALRFCDGLFSLLVNYVVLLGADDLLPLFLNFAALQFLQSIDNIALDMAATGFLSILMEHDAVLAKGVRLSKRPQADSCMRSLDAIFFLFTVTVMMVVWGLFYRLGGNDADEL